MCFLNIIKMVSDVYWKMGLQGYQHLFYLTVSMTVVTSSNLLDC